MIKTSTMLSFLGRRRVESLAVVIAGVVAVPFVTAREAAPIGAYTVKVARAVIGPTSVEQTSDWDLANINNARVDSWISRFQSDLKQSMAIYLERMDRYDDMITTKLAEREMPQELIYLAMIESGFDPKAKSPVSASGLWQFMGATGRQYGLTVTKKVDERNDPSLATDAALSYLDDLHERFGSWYLAFAAYNSGEGRVARVMKSTLGRATGTDADFYRIAGRLPKETRDYVPKMIAAARIAKNPARYGFEPRS